MIRFCILGLAILVSSLVVGMPSRWARADDEKQTKSPDVVYVPSYNPNWAYGAWSEPAYPPTYYPPPAGYGYGTALASGLMWGLGKV